MFDRFFRKLDELPDISNCDRPSPESFSKLEKFDTDIQGCLGDPKKALSYQTGTSVAFSSIGAFQFNFSILVCKNRSCVENISGAWDGRRGVKGLHF